jgi:DNA-binding Lrp family transcriptional regulator
MAEDFLGTFMGSNVRAKVLRVFAFNPGVFTVSQVAKRAGVSARVAGEEIRELEKCGMLKAAKFIITVNGSKAIAGKQKEQTWTMDQSFKHASAISKFVYEVSPMENKSIIIALRKAGRLSVIILSGVFVGDASRPADIIVAGDSVNEGRLETAIKALEPQLGREIRYSAFSTPEFQYRMTIQDRLLRETLDFPHLVLLDKTRLL